MSELIFRTEPMRHQLAAVNMSLHEPFYAYLMEQGTGKTKVVIDRVQNLFAQNKLDAFLILAPNGVHANWITEQFVDHFRADLFPLHAVVFRSGASSKAYKASIEELFAPRDPTKRRLTVLSVNIESLALSASAYALCQKFLKHYPNRAFIALDESSGIKSPGITTSKRAHTLRQLAAYRAIMTGTEVTQGPLDFYSQFQFLYPGLLGCPNFATFKAHYAEWRERVVGAPGQKQRKYNELVRYKNLEQLKARVAKYSFQIRKKDCLDLPEKVYQTRPLVMGAEQRAVYNTVRQRVLAELGLDARSGGMQSITTQHVLTKSIRLSQIAGGFATLDDGTVKPLPNAKLAALLAQIEEIPADAQVIIWARFVAELNAICAALGDANCAKYWGEIGKADRIEGVEEFKAGTRRFMVAQQRAGGKGHTWIQGTFVIYYSNTFSWEDRSQSEDRAHRIGQTKNVTYIDLIAEDTIDAKIIKALKFKKDVAEFFKGCSLEELI